MQVKYFGQECQTCRVESSSVQHVRRHVASPCAHAGDVSFDSSATGVFHVSLLQNFCVPLCKYSVRNYFDLCKYLFLIKLILAFSDGFFFNSIIVSICVSIPLITSQKECLQASPWWGYRPSSFSTVFFGRKSLPKAHSVSSPWGWSSHISHSEFFYRRVVSSPSFT